jgi:hypothetical protein
MPNGDFAPWLKNNKTRDEALTELKQFAEVHRAEWPYYSNRERKRELTEAMFRHQTCRSGCTNSIRWLRDACPARPRRGPVADPHLGLRSPTYRKFV